MKSSTRPRVVIDANVFVSALIWGGSPKKVIDLWLKNKFELCISPETLFEIITVLERLRVEQKIVQRFQEIIIDHSIKIIPQKKFKTCSDPKDNKYLDLCFKCKADYLITGDKHLLILKQFMGTKILKPVEFLAS
jgi:putative PIN family toxin of toxin-antitoxin system